MQVATTLPRTPGPATVEAGAGHAAAGLADDDAQAAERYWQQGREHAREGRWPQAALAYGQATLALPSQPNFWFNLANAQRHTHQYERAVQAAQQGLAISPSDPLGLHLLGECLARLHCYAEAAQALAALEATGSSDTSAMLQHACMLQALQRPGPASEVLLRALMITPHLVRGHALLADALRDMGLKREAVECIKTVLALEPGNLEALSHMSFEKRHVGDWTGLHDDLAQIRKALAAGPPKRPRVAASFGLLSLPLSPAELLRAAQGEALALSHDVQTLPERLGLVETADERIRLGLVSFDFREHPVSQLLVQTLELINRQHFELYLYSAGPDDGSPLRQRVQASADHFCDLRGMSDQQAAERVRADGVHLLVDLAGHTRGHRLGVFARRPAPVQASYLGYPGSTGAAFIDYVIGDPIVTPLAHAAHFSEQLAQLPQCLQPNGRWRPLPAPMLRSEAGLPEAAFVMCAFNHTYKILPPAFDIWCAVLREVPASVLWLKQTNQQLQGNLLREAQARGVAPERVVFAPNLRYEQHFSRLALADVFVDTWPYNAHTTASDALWAGVPVLTLQGDTYASRVATSVLHAAGLGELAFTSADDYALALRALALQPELLLPYRQHLQQQRQQLPLFDCESHAVALQQLFTRMVKRWRAGQAPAHLLAESADGDVCLPGVCSPEVCSKPPPASFSASPPTTSTTSTTSTTRTWARWLGTFIGFPLAGVAARAVVGNIDSIGAAAVGGLVGGAVLGAVQAGIGGMDAGDRAPWIGATAVGLAVGLAGGATMVGFETDAASLVAMGALSGAGVGIAQALAVPMRGIDRAAWAFVTPLLWAGGWLITSQVIVDADTQHAVFGSSGALVVSAFAGVLYAQRRRHPIATSDAASVSVTTSESASPVRPSRKVVA